MVQEQNAIQDGADERMLGTEGADNDKLTEKRDEVKFIKGDQQNGDAKIDIGKIDGKAFTGMTKEELMKFANDPFWVRLRWIFFISFWLIWLAMLVGAILIIVGAPKCPAPQPLPWYKRGPMAKFSFLSDFTANDIKLAENFEATGAIYELPAELTYSVKDAEISERIRNLVAEFKKVDANVILDITPNYVSKDSQFMKDALVDRTKRSAFIWSERNQAPNNWLSKVKGSAWSPVQPGNYVLSQFGDGLYDLRMNDTIVKKELESTLRYLVELGVQGIRFRNSKYFLISANLEDEIPSDNTGFDLTQYEFWTHTQTTFQEGLGDLLSEYRTAMRNVTDNVFLSVTDDLVRPEVYRSSTGGLGIDLPIYGRFVHFLSNLEVSRLEPEMNNIFREVGNDTWLQWDYKDLLSGDYFKADVSAFTLFMSLLPGVSIIPMNNDVINKMPASLFDHIEKIRQSPSFMHGDFDMYRSGELIAYSRIKTGSPGYFVVFNPTSSEKTANFTGINLPDIMTVDIISENFNTTAAIVGSRINSSFDVSPYATIILTYVPVKSG